MTMLQQANLTGVDILVGSNRDEGMYVKYCGRLESEARFRNAEKYTGTA